jgi:hypothetical protein
VQPTATPSPTGTSTATQQYPANIDFPIQVPYGQYSQAALANPNVQGIDINLNWNLVEPQEGQINFAPLDAEMAAWAQAGKKVVLVLRFANETGGTCTGGILPGWERGKIQTLCDTDLNSVVPDYFDPTFQADWKAFVGAIAAHVNQSPYRSAVIYVRAAVGLAGEGFFLHYGTAHFGQYKQQLTQWGYSPAAWAQWQENMMSYYASVFAPLTVIYPIVRLDPDPGTGKPVQQEVAQWAVQHGMGIGAQGLVPNYPTDYANIKEIASFARTSAPAAYIQFQTVSRVNGEVDIAGDIATACALHAHSIEWYERDILNPAYQADFQHWQSLVNSNAC